MALPSNQNYQVSATGGSGASGQPQRYIPGMNAMGSSGKETMAQQAGAPMASVASAPEVQLPALASITSESQRPEEPITSGVDIGSGPGSSSLNLPQENNDNSPFNQAIKSYYPVLKYIASRPETAPETRRALISLMNNIE